jgi:hypothetical protein|tara:strand:- start:401 stop:1789 length:1389 start_codon:yes stop_codon:yes gene_type:complete
VDEDFDDGYGDPSDYGMSSRDFDDASQVGFGVSGTTSQDFSTGDSAEDYSATTPTPFEIANFVAQPQFGQNRSNVVGMSNYDPAFAAALDISRGLDPTNNFGGTGGLTVPSSLRPQIEGERGPLGPKYYSDVERIAQEKLPPMIQGIQKIGIGGLLDSIMGTFTDAKNALGKMGDAVGGISLPDLFSSDNSIPNISNEQANMGTLDPSDRFLGDMSQQNAFIPTAGITNIRPDLSREANISVADATNQPFFEEGPPTPIDSGPGIQIVPGSGQNRFQFATSTGAPLPGAFPMGNVSDILNFSDLERETQRLSPYEKEFLSGRRDSIMGEPPTFRTADNFNASGITNISNMTDIVKSPFNKEAIEKALNMPSRIFEGDSVRGFNPNINYSGRMIEKDRGLGAFKEAMRDYQDKQFDSFSDIGNIFNKENLGFGKPQRQDFYNPEYDRLMRDKFFADSQRKISI